MRTFSVINADTFLLSLHRYCTIRDSTTAECKFHFDDVLFSCYQSVSPGGCPLPQCPQSLQVDRVCHPSDGQTVAITLSDHRSSSRRRRCRFGFSVGELLPAFPVLLYSFVHGLKGRRVQGECLQGR
eukprot:m.136216 g.136216  ORF g.136216 m.136216 type:complete len:127 (+) comp38172_c1_seq126:4296-4676(+)